MYGTSDPLVGYAYSRCLRSLAGTPERIARANRLMTSSACGPSRCAPTTRPVWFSTMTLNIAHVSATRRLEYQLDVSCVLTRMSSCCSRAFASVSPTPASGGTVNTTLGMPRKSGVRVFPLRRLAATIVPSDPATVEDRLRASAPRHVGELEGDVSRTDERDPRRQLVEFEERGARDQVLLARHP